MWFTVARTSIRALTTQVLLSVITPVLLYLISHRPLGPWVLLPRIFAAARDAVRDVADRVRALAVMRGRADGASQRLSRRTGGRSCVGRAPGRVAPQCRAVGITVSAS